jgi:hypothetical protein
MSATGDPWTGAVSGRNPRPDETLTGPLSRNVVAVASASA